jgi:putative component of toxin-antitoxin plasmid stabilization module
MADYTPEFFEDDDGSEPVLDWLRKLSGYKRRAATAAIEHILARQGAGVCRSGWGKWVQGVDGVFELRIRQDYGTILRNAGLPIPDDEADEAAERHPDILLRIFCHAHGNRMVLLLAGYDKGKEPQDRRQTKEAKLAEKRLKRWRQRQAAAAKRAKRTGGRSRKRKS